MKNRPKFVRKVFDRNGVSQDRSLAGRDGGREELKRVLDLGLVQGFSVADDAHYIGRPPALCRKQEELALRLAFDRCHDFENIFAKKIGWVFCSKYC
jgi:hypothetical protein